MNKSISLFLNLFFNKKCKNVANDSRMGILLIFSFSRRLFESLRMLKDICECLAES